jgi:hypothetical protein
MDGTFPLFRLMTEVRRAQVAMSLAISLRLNINGTRFARFHARANFAASVGGHRNRLGPPLVFYGRTGGRNE